MSFIYLDNIGSNYDAFAVLIIQNRNFLSTESIIGAPFLIESKISGLKAFFSQLFIINNNIWNLNSLTNRSLQIQKVRMKNKNSEQCINLINEKRCEGLWYKYRAKPDDIKGFCINCSKKEKE